MSSPVVSVIIPVYNGEQTIGQTIRAALAQDCKESLEVIVVDDGSTDRTAQIVKEFPQVRYFRQENAGPAAARNAGAAEAGGKFLFFTDADCLPRPDWVRLMTPPFSEPKVAAVMGSYGIANPKKAIARLIHFEITYRHQHLMPLYPKVFGSYNVAIRKETFSQVDGFNTGYRYASGEDNDLSYKVLAAGGKIYFEKAALVDHHHTEALGKYLREQYRHGYWRVKMYRQHPKMSGGDDYTFWKDIIEVPSVAAIVVLTAGALAGFAWSLPLLGMAVLFLAVIELYFGIVICSSVVRGIGMAAVMFLRAFARTFGFCHGLLRHSG